MISGIITLAGESLEQAARRKYVTSGRIDPEIFNAIAAMDKTTGRVF